MWSEWKTGLKRQRHPPWGARCEICLFVRKRWGESPSFPLVSYWRFVKTFAGRMHNENCQHHRRSSARWTLFENQHDKTTLGGKKADREFENSSPWHCPCLPAVSAACWGAAEGASWAVLECSWFRKNSFRKRIGKRLTQFLIRKFAKRQAWEANLWKFWLREKTKGEICKAASMPKEALQGPTGWARVNKNGWPEIMISLLDRRAWR